MDHWNVKRTVYSVGDFLGWMKGGELELSPSFQRRPVWKPKAKAFFLDTLIRGLPVPIVFVREKLNVQTLRTVREIVDGQQRLRSVFAFIDPSSLKNYKRERDDFTLMKTYSPDYPGLGFGDLPKEVREEILGYQFSVDVLPRNADDAAVLNIFKRLNSTGVRLNDQELRNAEYFGEFSASVYDMALNNLGRWRKWSLFTEDAIARMEEAEFVSELYVLMHQGIFGRNKSVLDSYYKANDEEFASRKICEKRLSTVLNIIESHFGEEVKSSVFQKRTLFFVLFAAIYDYSYGLPSPLKTKLAILPPKGLVKKLTQISADLSADKAPTRVLEAAARRTTHKNSREILFKYIRARIK
jgi:hypothetical protein